MILRVLTPLLSPSRRVRVAGSVPELGCWRPDRAPVMEMRGIPLWTLSVRDLPPDTEYKFIITEGDEVIWEEGPDRTVASRGPLEFRGLPRWHAAGVAVPVFSLRSDDDWGCGDFRSLRMLTDWAAACGMSVIQLLPVNDTTATRTAADSYPYNACSSFALHPMYMRPWKLELLPAAGRESLLAERDRLQALPAVDYEGVIRLKERYARLIFEAEGDTVTRSSGFASFVGDNASWLLPYCAYSVLRDRYSTPDFRSWPDHAVYSGATVASLLLDPAARGEMLYYAYVQYQLHLQLLQAGNYARSRGVAFKGDIPIGVSRDSADAWQHPDLFNLDSSAGAPPDDFAVKGQNWGFPTYNWERMAADGYSWWRARLGHMALYFDAYRIDHILGFFRIWEIPVEYSGGLRGHFSPALPLSPAEMAALYGFRFDRSMAFPSASDADDLLFVPDPRTPGLYHPRIAGYNTRRFAALDRPQQDAYLRLHEDFFYSRHDNLWRSVAETRLPGLLDASPMLACAEDLGMIPACVPSVLTRLSILSLEVRRMPKAFGVELADTSAYPYLSVATTSTHDMPPLRLWHKLRTGADMTPAEVEAELTAHLRAPSMLVVLPLQDWLGASASLRAPSPDGEQINVPADPRHYWRYRMHLPLERLIADTTFARRLSALIHHTNS